MNRAGKQAEISFLSDCAAKAQIMLCADYHGLTVSEMTDLRRRLRAGGSFGRVAKNTLARLSIEKAFQECEANEREKFLALFEGPNFVVFANEDPVASAKVIAQFAKEHKSLEIKGGWFEGKFADLAKIKALSTLPSREELLAQLLNLISAPASQLVQLLQAPSRQLVQVLDGHRTNLEKRAS